MARRRDTKADYARRNQQARDAGWKSYGQERYAKGKLNKASSDVQGKWNRFLLHKGSNLNRTEERRAFRAFWQGLIDPKTRDDTSRNSPKAIWFVDYTHQVEDYDTWEEKYSEDE